MRLHHAAGMGAAVALIVLLGLPGVTLVGAQTAKGGVPGYRHIFIIVMENKAYADIIGNSSAPQINALARTYGLATNYYAVTHPSEPNYVAMIGGDYFGIQDDSAYTTHTINQPSLASQLDARRLTWKSYQESLAGPGYLGTFSPNALQPLYASKHNPFLNFVSVQHSTADLQKIVPMTQLTKDLSSGHVPNFSFIVPNQCDDMHGGMPGCLSSDISLGDSVAGKLVTTIMRSLAWSQGNNAIAIVWDENDGSSSGATGCCAANPGGGHVAAIVITNHGPRGIRDGTPYNHYSLLRTVQGAFGLGCLQHTCDQRAVKPMSPLFAIRHS